METSIEYQSYIADTKNIKTTQGRLDYQTPYTNDFEAIFSRVMDEDIKLSTAKNFIENLSPDELGTIQKYNGLADAIEKFLNDLRTKGAVVFLADFNKEKIEDMIKEFKEKLVKSMGSTPKNLVEIEQLVNAYKKQLLEEIQANLENDEKNTKIDTQAIVKILLDLKDKEEKPLEKLLQIDS